MLLHGAWLGQIHHWCISPAHVPTAGEGTAEQELELDAEAESLLEELSASQAEVQRMIDDHRRQQEELGGMRANLAAEVRVFHPAAREQ